MPKEAIDQSFATIKNYTGTNVPLANACRDLEIFIGDMDGAELVDGDGVDTSDPVRAINIIIDHLNGQTTEGRR